MYNFQASNSALVTLAFMYVYCIDHEVYAVLGGIQSSFLPFFAGDSISVSPTSRRQSFLVTSNFHQKDVQMPVNLYRV